jgi:hypothetical protein
MKASKKIVYVFLRNKIVGIDSILSTCMEIYGRCGYTFNFISFDYMTYKYIVEDNTVIRDAINHIGKIELVSSDRYSSSNISRLFILFYFIRVIFNVAVRNYYIMHSSHLHVKPFVLVKWLFKKSNIIFVEKKSFNNEIRIGTKKHNLQFIYDRRLTYDEISKYNIDLYSHPPLLYADTLIGYDENWNYFKHPAADKSRKIIFKDIRRGKYWIDFVNKNASKYIDSEMPFGDFESNKILVFIATRITRNTDHNAIDEFTGALRVLFKYTHVFPLFIKLHTFSDLDFIDELLSIASDEKNSTRYVITHLHPAVLATRSIISVFANSGTLMSEFSKLGIPVVDLQIYENTLLPSSCLNSSTELSEKDLTERYKYRSKHSDYTFTCIDNFDKFMKGVINTSFGSDSIKPILAASQKTMSCFGTCELLKE